GGPRDQAAHARELANLLATAACSGADHQMDRVKTVLSERQEDIFGDAVAGLQPQLDHLSFAILLAEIAALVALAQLLDGALGGAEPLFLASRGAQVAHAQAQPAARGVAETERLEPIKQLGSGSPAETGVAVADDAVQRGTRHCQVVERHPRREHIVE